MSRLQLEAVEAAASEGRIHEIAAQCLRGDVAEVTIGRALLRHAHLLIRHPALVLPAVYALAWFHGDEARGILAGWHGQWRAADRGPWLRALRPPAFGLDEPIRGEYRGIKRDFYPWPVGLESAPSGVERYALDALTHRPGFLSLRRAGSAMTEVLIGDDVQFSSLINLSDGHVVAAGHFVECRGVVVRVDVKSGEVAWRTDFGRPIKSVNVSADLEYVVVEEAQRGHVALGIRNGRKLTRFPHAWGRAQLSPAGDELAVFHREVLRIWSGVEPTAWHSELGPEGVVGADFSPDGRLLLCGTTLFDGASGQRLTRLPLESESYLLGGPAPGCTRVVNDGVIEAGALRGFQRWDAQGKKLLDDPSRRYFQGEHTIAIDPLGRFYAVGPAERGPIEILKVRSGQVVRKLERESLSALCWDFEGRLLANVAADGRIHLTPVGGKEQVFGEHPGAHEICFSWDGKLVATGSEERQILWRLRDYEPVSKRAKPRLRRLDDWPGFRASRHGLEGRLRGGLFTVTENGRNVMASVPCDEDLIASPDGRSWAGRDSHFALET